MLACLQVAANASGNRITSCAGIVCVARIPLGLHMSNFDVGACHLHLNLTTKAGTLMP